MFALAAGLTFGAYVLYRVAFSELALRARECLIPDVQALLQRADASQAAQDLALDLFAQSASIRPGWRWLLHGKIVAPSCRRGLPANELEIIKRIEAKAVVVGAIANPLLFVLSMILAAARRRPNPLPW